VATVSTAMIGRTCDAKQYDFHVERAGDVDNERDDARRDQRAIEE
jgi:hypothetical protein